MTTAELKRQLAAMTEEQSRYEERLSYLGELRERYSKCADKLDVALLDVKYWRYRAEKAEAELAATQIDADINEQVVTVGEVAAAFERLLDRIERSGCDLKYGQVVYFAQIDVLDILTGKWNDETADEIDEPAELSDESGWGVF